MVGAFSIHHKEDRREREKGDLELYSVGGGGWDGEDGGDDHAHDDEGKR